MLTAFRKDKAADRGSDQGGRQRSQPKPPKQSKAAKPQPRFCATVTLNGKSDNLTPLQHDLRAILDHVRTDHPEIIVQQPPLLVSTRTLVINIYSSSITTANAASNVAAAQLVAAGWKLTSKPLPGGAKRVWRAVAIQLEKHKLEITGDVWLRHQERTAPRLAPGPPTGYSAGPPQPRTRSGLRDPQQSAPSASDSHGTGRVYALPAPPPYVRGAAPSQYGAQQTIAFPRQAGQQPAQYHHARMPHQTPSGNMQSTSTSYAAQPGYRSGYIQPLEVTRAPRNTPLLGDPYNRFDHRPPALRQSILGRRSITSAAPPTSMVSRRGSNRRAPVSGATHSSRRVVVRRTPSRTSNQNSTISGLDYSPTYPGEGAYEDVSEFEEE